MRLTRISLRNFRGVEDSTVAFAEGVTVIEGPNEVGKSSIAEAIRLIRRYKSSSRHSDITRVQPVGRDVGPEVELDLRTGPYDVTYRKRWLKSVLTELTVRAPKVEQISGDPAHDRFRAILEETVDADLLEALDVIQGRSLDLPDLATIPALKRALDDSAGGAADHEDLLARIGEEYSRYFTAGGRPTGVYKKTNDRVAELHIAVEDLAKRSEEMDRFTAEHERYSGVLTDLTEQLARAKGDAKAREDDAKALDVLRRTAEDAEREVADANRALSDAKTARDGRVELVGDLQARSDAATDLELKVSTLDAEHEAATKALDSATDVAKTAEERCRAAREASDAANTALGRRRDRRDRDDLTDRLGRARAAEQARVAATALLEQAGIDDEAVARLVDLETEVRVAERTRDAAAATVSVHRLGDRDVAVNGTTVAAGQPYLAPVLDQVRVEVDGVVSVEVSPGTSPAALESSLREAKNALETALREPGVASIDDARVVAERRRAAEAELATSASELGRVLAGSTLETLEEKLAVLDARLKDASEGDMTTDIGHLEVEADGARAAEQEADSALMAATASLEDLRVANDNAREAWIRASEELRTEARERDRVVEQLEQARRTSPDDALDAAVQRAEAAIAERGAAANAARAEFEAADPDTVDMLLSNARLLVESKQTDQGATRDRVAELRALLDDRAREGIYDLLTTKQSELDDARASYDRLDRSAMAVELLREVMHRHRNEAHQKYAAPFKDHIERLGRVVFGPDFQVSVSNELAVESRTLDGTTVPFDSLSAGAREQVALIGRLACAQLVDADEGAPVILDDTLGFADPERLTLLNVVLGEVGRSAQVVLLTCQPQRFESLGGARIMRLPAS